MHQDEKLFGWQDNNRTQRGETRQNETGLQEKKSKNIIFVCATFIMLFSAFKGRILSSALGQENFKSDARKFIRDFAKKFRLHTLILK